MTRQSNGHRKIKRSAVDSIPSMEHATVNLRPKMIFSPGRRICEVGSFHGTVAFHSFSAYAFVKTSHE